MQVTIAPEEQLEQVWLLQAEGPAGPSQPKAAGQVPGCSKKSECVQTGRGGAQGLVLDMLSHQGDPGKLEAISRQ